MPRYIHSCLWALCLGGLCLTLPPPALAQCGDDPRLEHLETLSMPVSPPLTVTPETYVRLHPDLERHLAGSLVICPNNPVREPGKPLLPVTAEFTAIWDKVSYHISRQEWDEILQLRNRVRAKPMPPKQALSLLVTTILNENAIKNLTKALLTQVYPLGRYRDSLQRRTFIFVADVYAQFGGRISSPCSVVVSYESEKGRAQSRNIKAQRTDLALEFVFPSKLIFGELQKNTLHKLGFTVLDDMDVLKGIR